MKKIILASQSPGRKKILEDEGFVFDIMPSDYEEDMTVALPPHTLAIQLSLGKARSIAEKSTDALVIGADTFGVYEGKLLGKPHTAKNAKKMLEMLSGNMYVMVTGLTVIDTDTKKEISTSVETKIWFKNIPEEEINEYVATGESLQKAGGYAYQGIGKKFIAKVEGSESNILGMPIEVLKEIMQQFA